MENMIVLGDEALMAVAGGHRKCGEGERRGHERRGGSYSKTTTVGNVTVDVTGNNDTVSINIG